MFEDFKTNFRQHVVDSKKASGKSYFDLRSDWGFDVEQFVRNKTSPKMQTYFAFCTATKNCVVELFITCLKDQIHHDRLVNHINKTFNTNYINN